EIALASSTYTITTTAVGRSSHPPPIWQMLFTSRSTPEIISWQRAHSNLKTPCGYVFNRVGQSNRDDGRHETLKKSSTAKDPADTKVPGESGHCFKLLGNDNDLDLVKIDRRTASLKIPPKERQLNTLACNALAKEAGVAILGSVRPK